MDIIFYTVFSVVILFQLMGIFEFFQRKYTSETVKFLTDASLATANLEQWAAPDLRRLALYVTAQGLTTIVLSVLFMTGTTDFRIVLIVLFLLSRFAFKKAIDHFLNKVNGR